MHWCMHRDIDIFMSSLSILLAQFKGFEVQVEVFAVHLHSTQIILET